MGRTRRLVLTAAAVTALLVVAGLPVAASSEHFAAPGAGGVVKPGSDVPFRLAGAGDCDALTTYVVLTADDTSVNGPPAAGCDGVATAPLLPEELATEDVQAVLVSLRSGSVVALQPLTLRRRQAEHADTTNREMTAVPTTDPLGGGTHLERLQPEDAISFSGVDLTGISSVSFRIASGGNGARLELRDGSPDGTLLGAVDAGGTGGWDSWLSVSAGLDRSAVPDGALDLFVVVLERPYQLLTWPWTPPHARDLPAVCDAPGVGDLEPCTSRDLVSLNFVDLNGHGVAEPYRFGADEPGFSQIFDGSSLDGWRMAGPGSFQLTGDGAACSEGGMGLLWYEPETYGDFVLRSEFKVTTFRDNSGIFMRFPDPGDDPWVAVDEGYEVQIDDSFPSFQRTGSVYTFSAAEPLETNAVGEWNALEITVVGQSYRVVLNGVEVTTYTGNRGTEGHVGLQNNDYFDGSQACFRDIRVKHL